MTSVTRADVTPDMRYARVFVSVLGGPDALAQCLKGLKSASGFLRRELGRRLQLRYTPELLFAPDESIAHGIHIMELIEKVSEQTES